MPKIVGVMEKIYIGPYNDSVSTWQDMSDGRQMRVVDGKVYFRDKKTEDKKWHPASYLEKAKK